MSSKRPRVKLPSETPLDDGTRKGTEEWREVDGVEFCHWDRWLLRLSLEEPAGLVSISREAARQSIPPHVERPGILRDLLELVHRKG